MSLEPALYPFRFEPIYQYRLWGGRKLEHIVAAPLPPDQPIGEAWILSDRDDFTSLVAEGPLAGKSIQDLIQLSPKGMFGERAGKLTRYPLLLKFLDAQEMLSVQVHPSDAHKDLLPPGERGKTEAWVVLESEPESSIFAGLKPGTTAEDIRHGLATKTVADDLASFRPKPGDGVLIRAGTVHALGGGVVVFEVQQNSDVTFRLYDWDRVDPKTGKPRELHIEDSLKCIDFTEGPVDRSIPKILETAPVLREELFSCEFFITYRFTGTSPFTVGAEGALRSIVVLDGAGHLSRGKDLFPFRRGEVWLLPAEVGVVGVAPEGSVTLLEIELP
jgi:mannose-6-phosphate isomerase